MLIKRGTCLTCTDSDFGLSKNICILYFFYPDYRVSLHLIFRNGGKDDGLNKRA